MPGTHPRTVRKRAVLRRPELPDLLKGSLSSTAWRTVTPCVPDLVAAVEGVSAEPALWAGLRPKITRKRLKLASDRMTRLQDALSTLTPDELWLLHLEGVDLEELDRRVEVARLGCDQVNAHLRGKPGGVHDPRRGMLADSVRFTLEAAGIRWVKSEGGLCAKVLACAFEAAGLSVPDDMMPYVCAADSAMHHALARVGKRFGWGRRRGVVLFVRDAPTR